MAFSLARLLLALAAPFPVLSRCPGGYAGTPPAGHAPVPSESAYSSALRELDVKAVVADVEELLTDSQEWWPADYGHYGPFFVRLAWHCSGTYRATDGRGGCAGGRQRFEPEASWSDNTNLDKARALLAPIKEKHGDGLSWGDLFVTAGTVAIRSMGGPVTELCFGRADDTDGTESLVLDPNEDGDIYVNAEGPMVKGSDGVLRPHPDPDDSAPEIRMSFQRMGMNDTETVALIGGGHAFGKAHGACPSGPGPSPKEKPDDPWPGTCGTGKGSDTFTSGFEGAWTTTPTRWSNEFFTWLLDNDWEKFKGPGGRWQWRIEHAKGSQKGVMRLTTDLALVEDDKYKKIVKRFAKDPRALDDAFSNAWFKLTTRGGRWSEDKRCVPAAPVEPYV